MLNLVNAKAALMRQAQTLHLAEAAQEDGYLMDPDAEIDRVKAVISRYSSSRLRVSTSSILCHLEQILKRMFADL